MADILLSVIIPVYNAKMDLIGCLESIRLQTWKDYELILVDDGSTDGSGLLCDEYADKDNRIRVIHQNNKGQSCARNVGIDNAIGKYIGFVDDDDSIAPNMFEVLLSNALLNDYDISASSFMELKEDGRFVHNKHNGKIVVLSKDEGVKQILSRQNLDIYVWTKIYKRSFINDNHIKFENGKNDEDILFNFAAYAKASSSIVIDDPLYIYHYKSGSESRLIRKERVDNYLSGTWYRVNKIVSETKNDFPQYVELAERQKMIYCLQMLDAILRAKLTTGNDYYKRVMSYFHANKVRAFRNRQYLGMRRIGVFCLIFFPAALYYMYKTCKIKLDDKVT